MNADGNRVISLKKGNPAPERAVDATVRLYAPCVHLRVNYIPGTTPSKNLFLPPSNIKIRTAKRTTKSIPRQNQNAFIPTSS